MTSSHHAPYALGDTRATMAGTKRSRSREGGANPKKPVLSSDCRLQLACMKPESLVIAASAIRAVNSFPGLVHTAPSHYGSWPCPKSLPLTFKEDGCRRQGLVTGVKS